MRNAILIILSILILTSSCDPGCKNYIRNNSNDTLKIYGFINSKKNRNAIIDSLCLSFYDTLEFQNEILKNDQLNIRTDLNSILVTQNINDSILKISIPPLSTIRTNVGLADSRLFNDCVIDKIIFELSSNYDTLNMNNYFNEIKNFYIKNEMNLKKKGFYNKVFITDIYKIKKQ